MTYQLTTSPSPIMLEDSTIICDCSGTTVAKIKQLLDSGKTDLEAVSRATGACAGCGACESEVLKLIEDYNAPDCCSN